MRISKYICLIPFTFALAACGKWAEAKKESVNTLPIPDYPSVQDDVFTLKSPLSKIDYKGTLIILNDEGKPELLADIINASVAVRDAWGDIRKFEQENSYVGTYTDGGLAYKNLELMRDGIQAFEVEALNKNPISAEDKKKNATTWLNRELEKLSLTVEQRATFDSQWGAYCEAKVIELGVHPVASSNNFLSLPTPSAICSEYYAANGYFTGPSCTAPQEGDYTRCLWSEGILKTRWFTVPEDNPTLAQERTEKRQKVEAMFDVNNYASTRGVLNNTASSFNMTANKAFLRQYYEQKDAFVKFALDQSANPTNCPKVIKNVASQDLCKIFGLGKGEFSPREVIGTVEGSAAGGNDQIFAKLPNAPDRTVTTQQLIRFLGERSRMETSVNDRLFFETAEGKLMPQPSFASGGKEFKDLLPQIRQALASEFYGSLSEDDLAIKAENMKAVTSLEAQIQGKRDTWDSLNAEITRTTNVGITAANKGNVALGFFQYTMSFEQKDDILHAYWSTNETRRQVFKACFNLVTNESAECVLPDNSANTYHPATLTLSANGSRLDFSFNVTNALEQGFGPKARVKEEGKAPDFFMDLTEDQWNGRTLRFELYRNRIKGHLDVITGKAFIENEGRREFEGGVSSWQQAD